MQRHGIYLVCFVFRLCSALDMDPMVGLKENFVDSNIRELMENGDRMDRKMK